MEPKNLKTKGKIVLIDFETIYRVRLRQVRTNSFFFGTKRNNSFMAYRLSTIVL